MYTHTLRERQVPTHRAWFGCNGEGLDALPRDKRLPRHTPSPSMGPARVLQALEEAGPSSEVGGGGEGQHGELGRRADTQLVVRRDLRGGF